MDFFFNKKNIHFPIVLTIISEGIYHSFFEICLCAPTGAREFPEKQCHFDSCFVIRTGPCNALSVPEITLASGKHLVNHDLCN